MPLVKLVSSGLGLAFEANAARKAHKVDKAARSRGTSPMPRTPGEDSPEGEVLDVPEDHARELVDSGKAVPVDLKKQPLGDEEYEEYEDAPPTYAEAENMDEADWQLDEAAGERDLSPSSSGRDESSVEKVPSSDADRKHYVDKIVQKFIKAHPHSLQTGPAGQLPCPVIIPQRRPHKKSRGFVNAYAPVLANCGIDQDTFMQFHKAMYKSSLASPVFNVINLAAAIAGCVPSVAAMVTSMLVQAATRIAIEIQSRQRSNAFLDQMNDQFFRPRGLFCMVMKFDPKQTESHEMVDVSQTIMKSLTSSNSKTKEQMSKLKSSKGKTYGEIEMPEAAPLIFPGLDKVEDIDEKGKPKGGMKKTGEFVANYYDKRAQAKFIAENHDSTLASALPQEQKFASRFGDPNHPVNNGSLISLVTGGKIQSSGRGRGGGGGMGGGRGGRGGGLVGLAGALLGGGRQGGLGGGLGGGRQGGYRGGRGGNYRGGYGDEYENDYGQSNGNGHGRDGYGHDQYGRDGYGQDQYGRSRYGQDRYGQGGYGQDPYGGRGRQQGRGGSSGASPISYVKRMLKPNTLYLMIVNMPTDEEIDEARAIIAAVQK